MTETVDGAGDAIRRFVVEIAPAAADGRISGSVQPPGAAQPVPFSGWLDLLRLLEPAADDAPSTP